MSFRVTLLPLIAAVGLFGLSSQLAAKVDISKGTYDALAQVHQLIEKGRYEEATTRLEAIGTAKASSYEQALLLQTRGHLFARKGKHKEAIAALKASLALGALPKPAVQDTRLLLIQMQAAASAWEDAAVGMDAWLASERRPSAQANALAGSIYSRVKRPKNAADRLRRAIDQSKKPPELWYRQLAAVHLQTESYGEAAALLGDMIRRFPQRKEYWLQLSAVYQTLDDDARALALMELAYRRGLAFDEGELQKLVSFLIYKNRPYQGGGILENALRKGALPSTADNWQQLSDAWFRAGEIRKALGAAERALEIAPSADLQLRRAQLAAEIEDWIVVEEAAGAALSAGGLEDPGTAHLLRGVALHNLHRRADALAAFRQARLFETSRQQAEQWMDFLTPSVAAVVDVPHSSSGFVPDPTDS